jgi:hypothetical protein
MDRDPYAIALGNAMSEIKRAYPEIINSFIFTKNEEAITGDTETDQKAISSIQESFRAIKEKAKVIGNITGLQVSGKSGKLTISRIDDMYLVLGTSKNVDATHIYSITHVIIPTIMKTFKTMETPTPTHLQAPPPKKLVVETLGRFFAGDSVQIDTEVLESWTMDDDPRARVKAAITGESAQKVIEQVEVETFSGNSMLCKVKEIDDKKMKGKETIRIPEKLCKSLEIKNGDLVKVQPAD